MKTLVFGQFGSQALSPVSAAAAARSHAALWRGPGAPARLERGRFIDPAGNENIVWLAYWPDVDAYERWHTATAVREFWQYLPLDGPAGYWREVSIIPREHLDAVYCEAGWGDTVSNHPARTDARAGVANLSGWRDLLDMGAGDPLSAEPLRPELAAFTPTRVDTRGRRIHLEGPGNLCLIRSGPETDIGPMSSSPLGEARRTGLESLVGQPESGCIAVRRVWEQDVHGLDGDHRYTIAWFLSLAHLLRWARAHNGHLLIYASFFRMVAGRDGQPVDRNWWHEVSVLPRGYVVSEYVNCHNATGLLPLLDSAVEMALAGES